MQYIIKMAVYQFTGAIKIKIPTGFLFVHMKICKSNLSITGNKDGQY